MNYLNVNPWIFRNSFFALCVCTPLRVTCEKRLSFLHYSHMAAVADRLVVPHAAMPTVFCLTLLLSLCLPVTLAHSSSVSLPAVHSSPVASVLRDGWRTSLCSICERFALRHAVVYWLWSIFYFCWWCLFISQTCNLCKHTNAGVSDGSVQCCTLHT